MAVNWLFLPFLALIRMQLRRDLQSKTETSSGEARWGIPCHHWIKDVDVITKLSSESLSIQVRVVLLGVIMRSLGLDVPDQCS